MIVFPIKNIIMGVPLGLVLYIFTPADTLRLLGRDGDIHLYFVFLKIGLFSFGGRLSMLVLIEK